MATSPVNSTILTPFHQDCPMEMTTSHPVTRNQGWVKPACAPRPTPCPCLGISWSPHRPWLRSKAEALVRPCSHELHRHSPCGCQVAMSSFCLMGSMKEWQQHSDNQPWTEIKEHLSIDVRTNSCFSRLFFYPHREATVRQESFSHQVKEAAAAKKLFAFLFCLFFFLRFSLRDKFSSVRDCITTQICWLKNSPKGLHKMEKKKIHVNPPQLPQQTTTRMFCDHRVIPKEESHFTQTVST